ncbi:MAG: radical SAM protein [Deltaproteobacteria bacterium]|nr:MAG: radical SAM protein [Deltaproteobacteria bacterium]
MFEIVYENKKFKLLAKENLSQAQQVYLEKYLQKASSYKRIGVYQSSPVFSLYQPPLATRVGARSLDQRLKRRFESLRVPASATIAINKACQCECEHCSAVFYNHSSKANLDTEQLRQALLESVDLGVTNLILLGGEPLLRKDLCFQIQQVNPDKSVVTLFTNGEYLHPENCQKLSEAGLMGAFISLDDMDEGVHDRLRKRPGLFQKALRGIENLQKNKVLTAISTYLTPDRVHDGVLDKMMEFGKKIGVNEVTFFDAIPSGRWIHKDETLLQEDDRQQIAERVNHYRKSANYPGISAQSTLTSHQGSAFCFAANTQFYLSAHGEMCPCDFTPLTIGKFPEESLETLWNKMIHTPPYDCRSKVCRMQDPVFRKKYIDPLDLQKSFPQYLESF